MKNITDEDILKALASKAMIGGQGPALVAAVRDILAASEDDKVEFAELERPDPIEDVQALLNLAEIGDPNNIVVARADILLKVVNRACDVFEERVLAAAENEEGPESVVDFLEKLGPTIVRKALPAALEAALPGAVEAATAPIKAELNDANEKLVAYIEAAATSHEQTTDAAESIAGQSDALKAATVALIQAEIDKEENGTRRNAMKDVLAKVSAL